MQYENSLYRIRRQNRRLSEIYMEKEKMRDINKILPKLPKNSYATISNFPLSTAEIKETGRMFRYDSKWHTLFNEKDFITIDGKSILKQSAERFT